MKPMRRSFAVDPALWRMPRRPRLSWGGVMFFASILGSGAIFALAVLALIWAFALLEAVLA